MQLRYAKNLTTGAVETQSGGVKGNQADLDVMRSNMIGDGSNGLQDSDVETGWLEESVLNNMKESFDTSLWASDLLSAKAKKKSELSVEVTGAFAKNVDPHYLKYSRKLVRGAQGQSKPGTAITNYEDALTDNQDTANDQIDGLVSIQAVKDYTGMVWPQPPIA